MAGTAIGKLTLYALLHALKKGVGWTADSIHMLLLSTVVATANTWQYESTITHEFTTGGGYTKGTGITLSSCTVSATKANTWSVSRANTTTYKVNQIYRPATANGYVYRCFVAGKSGASIPTFPTVVGTDLTDGTAKFVNAGESVTVVTSAQAKFTPVTLSNVKGAVIVDKTPGSTATNPVLIVITFTTAASPQNGPLTITPDAHAGWAAWTPA